MTIIPYLAALDFPSDDKKNIVEFEKPIPSRSIGIITHKFFVKQRLAKELQNIIQESIAELIPDLKKTEIIKPV